ncbi:MAG: isoaspartyl peptidase/L-asparaginase [Pirellulales bacterium]
MIVGSSGVQSIADQPKAGRWAIALHGGAGNRSREMDRDERESLERSLRGGLNAGKDILSSGGSSLDVVEAVVVMLEDDPQFNAGKGAVFNRVGAHELDASIMDGSTLRCGAVAGVKFVKNPIKAARLVMERSPHVLLAGEGADQFAIENGCERVTQDYFYTDRRFREMQDALAKQGLEPLAKPAYSIHPHDPPTSDKPALEGAGGTVGCVALDSRGHLAAATSTGGLTGKLPGRVGDTAICGAGNYANKNCAVSATGRGEQYIRHSIAAKVAWLMAERRLTVDEAVRHCLDEILKPGDGGMIALDRDGKVSMHATTAAMPRGFADSTGRFELAIWIDAQVSP